MCALFSKEPSPGWKNFNDNTLPALASGFHLLLLAAICLFTLYAGLIGKTESTRTGPFVFAFVLGVLSGFICIGWVLFFMRSYLLSFLAFLPVAILTFPVGALQLLIARKAYNRWKGKE